LTHAQSIVKKYRNGTLLFGELIEFVTYDLIAQHIAMEDKQYFSAQPENKLYMREGSENGREAGPGESDVSLQK